MTNWTVDVEQYPGVLWLAVIGAPGEGEMQQFLEAHNAAVDGFAGASYRVFCDLRAMKVLLPESAEVFEQAKVYSSSQPNFRGSAVLIASQVVGMQHRRTSIAGGVMATELIGTDETILWEHLDSLPQ